jgi:hypothetical protein
MHRFVWNLRYPDPEAVHVQTPYNYPMGAIAGETPLPPQGPLVLPGKYEVRLTADGRTYRQPLEVTMDPRVDYRRNQLESVLALELKISATLGRNYAGYQQVKDLRSRLAEFTKRPAGDPIATAATQLDSKAAAIEGEPLSVFDTPKDSNFTIVNDSLVALIALVDGADFAPSEASFAALQRVCGAMNDTFGEWQQLKAKDLTDFRKLFDSQKPDAIPDYPSLTIDPNCGR